MNYALAAGCSSKKGSEVFVANLVASPPGFSVEDDTLGNGGSAPVAFPGTVANLVAPLQTGEAVVTYGRQLPHKGAGFLESFPRHFHYPPVSQKRVLADAAKLGIFTFFCSDSFSAYSNAALDAVGGIRPILTNED